MILIEKTIKGVEEDIDFDNKIRIVSSLSNLAGKLYILSNNVDSSKVCFEKALQLDPKSIAAYTGLGEIYYSLERYDESKSMFEMAITLDHQNESALKGLTKVNIKLNMSAENIKVENELLVKNKLKLIFELYGTGKYKETLLLLNDHEKEILNYLTETNDIENISGIYNLKGFLFFIMESYNAARENFEKALSINPSSSQACIGLGERFLKNNQSQEAKVMFEWGVKNNPENQIAIKSLSKVNKDLGLNENHSSLN